MEMENELKDALLSNSLPIFKNVQRIIEIQAESACGENENFVGQVLRLKCTLELSSGEIKSLSVIVKKQPLESQPFNEMYKRFKIFDSEVNMYEKVLFNMEKSLDECNESNWRHWPEYYGHSDTDIFLQDISVEGYCPYPKAKALELNEALMVFSSLGHFHGLSLSLIQRNIYDPSDMPPNVFVRGDSALNQVEIDACNNLADAIEAEWSSEWQVYPEKIRKLGENYRDIGMKLWQETRGKLDVINHGDCWINNMLFKYNESGLIEDIKFVDYQASHYNSYSWDMIQVLYSAVLPDLREDNLDLLLTTYLESLTTAARKTGYVGSLPGTEHMKEELDRLAPCALVRTFVCYPIFLNPEVMLAEKKTWDSDELGYTRSLYRSKFIRNIIEKTLTYFNKKKLI